MKEYNLKPIAGYDNYLISDCGQVFSKNRGVFMKQNGNGTGYFTVELFNNGKSKRCYVHRLVATAFVHNPDPARFKHINHINSIRNDNRADNLEWIDVSGNVRHSIKSNRYGASKLTIEQVKEIRSLKGIVTQEKLSKMFNVSRKQISLIQTGKAWII